MTTHEASTAVRFNYLLVRDALILLVALAVFVNEAFFRADARLGILSLVGGALAVPIYLRIDEKQKKEAADAEAKLAATRERTGT